MTSVLMAWVGNTDLKAPTSAEDPVGPILNALQHRSWDRAVLLCSFPEERMEPYLQWLRKQTDTLIESRRHPLEDPTDYEPIHIAVMEEVERLKKELGEDVALSFHLSPGTPQMATVFSILAHTRSCRARLIHTSREQKGVRDVKLPYELDAEFISRAKADIVRAMVAPPQEGPWLAGILHESPAMREALSRAMTFAPLPLPVLIEGESGTGKELVAEAIHAASGRKGRLVTVNCGAIPESLAEAELFGHARGAFTDAKTARPGKFQEADGGTLFLDEIGELPLAMQVKLLRVLQPRAAFGKECRVVIRPVMENKDVEVDVRIVVATNRSLREEMKAGRFRHDLYYRVSTAVVPLPPLRERGKDIDLIAKRFVERLNGELAGGRPESGKALAPGALRRLREHRWPGNIRELWNVVTKAFLFSTERSITAEDIARELSEEHVESPARLLDLPLGGFKLPRLMEDMEKGYIEKALKECGGNKTAAAGLLGYKSMQALDYRGSALGLWPKRKGGSRPKSS